MPEYRDISHLVKSVNYDQNVAHLTFRSDCGELTQTVSIPRQPEGHQAAPSGSERAPLVNWVRASLRRVAGKPRPQQALGDDELETLVLKAFMKVQDLLSLTEGQWLRCRKDEHPTEYFDRVLRDSPIIEPYDREVLVRVLLEISSADGEMHADELSFMHELIEDQQMVNRLSKAPKITIAELAEVSSFLVKQTILMLAWAMAYADGFLNPEETDVMKHVCQGFMLPEKMVRKLKTAAKLFLLDRQVEIGLEHLSKPELQQRFESQARKWGFEDDQLDTLKSWYPCLYEST